MMEEALLPPPQTNGKRKGNTRKWFSQLLIAAFLFTLTLEYRKYFLYHKVMQEALSEEEAVLGPSLRRTAEQFQTMESAKLKAEAEAEVAKLESEKLKLEVAKAKLEADKAKALADQASAAEKAAKENAAWKEKLAAQEKAAKEAEKAKNVALNEKMAAQEKAAKEAKDAKNARTEEAKKEAELAQKQADDTSAKAAQEAKEAKNGDAEDAKNGESQEAKKEAGLAQKQTKDTAVEAAKKGPSLPPSLPDTKGNLPIPSPKKGNKGKPNKKRAAYKDTDWFRLQAEHTNFEKYWRDNNGTAYAEYQTTHESKREPPSKMMSEFIVPQSKPKPRDIVLASHMSVNGAKLGRLDILRRFWQGPISLAVRIRSRHEIMTFFDYYEGLRFHKPKDWTIHFLFEYTPGKPEGFAAGYCHNRLRNMAMHSPVIPDYVLPVDLDFIPPYGGYPKLMELMEQSPELWDKMQQKKLLVLPVMEVMHIPETLGMTTKTLIAHVKNNPTNVNGTNDQIIEHFNANNRTNRPKIFDPANETDLPKSREELHILYLHGLAVEWHSASSQEPSNLTEYWSYQQNRENGNNNATYTINPSPKYEPYFIGYKPILPRYWERFRGFGLNKQSFVRECVMAQFYFEGLYEMYLTHLAHRSRRSQEFKFNNTMVWRTNFAPYLMQTYERPNYLKGRDKLWYLEP